MAKTEKAVVTTSSRGSSMTGGEDPPPHPDERSRAPASSAGADGRVGFPRAKRQLVLACAAIGGGLAVAGTVDRTTGGVIVLAGWLLGIAALHRLGRTGSDRGSEPPAD
jgi:hypothetical protein